MTEKQALLLLDKRDEAALTWIIERYAPYVGAACAAVARTLSYGQFTPTMRTWLELDVAAIPEGVEYEQVVAAETARYADVNHEARGELYVSAGVNGRSENIMVSVDLPPTFENDQPVALHVGEEEYPLVPIG